MSLIAISGDGQEFFLCLEDTGTSEQVVVKKNIEDTDWTEILRVTSTACNIAPSPGDDNIMFVFGFFGSDVQIQKYDIAGDTFTNISPSSLGSGIINVLQIDPSDPNIMIAGLDGGLKVFITSDGGSTWTESDLSETGVFDSLWGVWGGEYWPIGQLFSKTVASVTELLFSPNEMASTVDLTSPIPTGDTITKIDGAS